MVIYAGKMVGYVNFKLERVVINRSVDIHNVVRYIKIEFLNRYRITKTPTGNPNIKGNRALNSSFDMAVEFSE